MIQIDVEQRQPAVNGFGIGVVGEEGIEEIEQLPAITQSSQLVSDRLTVALLGEDSEAADGERQSNTDGDQGRGGESNRDRSDLMQRIAQQDGEAGACAEAREQESGGPTDRQWAGSEGTDPHGSRDEQNRSWPSDSIEDRPQMRRRPRAGKEVEGIANRRHADSAGKQQPLRILSSWHDRRASDREHEQQPVTDRVRKICSDSRGVTADGMEDGVEGEAGAQRGGAQAGHSPVEPCGYPHPVEMLSREEYQRDIDEGVEAQPEQIGE